MVDAQHYAKNKKLWKTLKSANRTSSKPAIQLNYERDCMRQVGHLFLTFASFFPQRFY
jgi:hypothetical protein